MSLYTALTQVLAPYAARLNSLLTGYDGTVYSTPGEAVRTQINDLHVLIGDEPGTAIDSSAIGYGEDSNVEDALDELNERLDDVKAEIDNTGLTVTSIKPTLSQGGITLSSGSLVYSESTTSCVTPNGSVIITEPGTIIKLLDKSVYKMRYWYSGNSTWYTGGSYSTNDITVPKQRRYVIQIARQDGGTVTATEAANAVQVVYPMSVGDMRNLGFYKTFSIADHLTKNGDLPASFNGLATESTASHITGFIPVFAGQVVSYRLKSSSGYYVMALYDADGNFTEGILGTSDAAEETYTFAANGFMRAACLVTFTDAYLYFSNYNQADREAQLRKEMSADIAANTSDINGMKASVSMLNTDINGMVDTSNIFEIGNITANTSGWTYSDSTKRIRTKEGVTLWLVPGDVISLTDYSNARFALGWRTSGGNYSGGSWHQEDFMVYQAGYYVMVISNLPEVALSSVDTLLTLVRIKKCVNLKSKALTAQANICAINHRGYNMIAPENTMPAFKLSKEMGFDWVETDISFTSDNVPVLLHDNTIDRTSDGTGDINSMTYAQVEEYDFGSWKSTEYTGTKIATLAELLDFCKKSGMRAYLELKSFGSSEANVKACAKLVQEYGLEDKMVWISFSAVSLEYIRDVIPSATLGYIVSTLDANAIATASGLLNGENTVFIGAPPNQFTSENIDAMIAEGISGNAYTVNTLTGVVEASKFVKSITTDCVNVPEALFTYANQ